MTDGSLIGPNLLGKLYDLTDAQAGTSREGTSPALGKLITWVMVTGGASPWWTGTVQIPDGLGVWTTYGPCEVMTSAGPLKSGRRYLAVRTGPKADGTTRFVAWMLPTVPRSIVTGWTCVDGVPSVTMSTANFPDV